MFSLCNPVGFSAYLITQRNHFTEPLMLYLLFGKVGRIASQNVAIELLMSKCVSVQYYGSECCPISKSQINLLEFAVCGSFMKIFSTLSKEIVSYCLEMFNVQTQY